MTPSAASETDRLLIERIRQGDSRAWSDLITRYEGRLLAYVESRLSERAASEDVVQETFVGFLNSLPNYDLRHSLESFLFSICAHKLTDHLRREGRRPVLAFSATERDSASPWQFSANQRGASSIVQSGERRNLEAKALATALRQQVQHWQQRGDWVKLQCLELLLVRGWTNKAVAAELQLSEQQVANYKSDFLTRLRGMLVKQGLSQDVFPELYQS